MACSAVEAGKAVLVEKPLALRLEDCDRLIALAGEKGIQIGTVSQLNYPYFPLSFMLYSDL